MSDQFQSDQFQSDQFQSEQSQPLVSVIMATYNRPQYLSEAIASVLRQTYTNFELIVSDDHSPDSPQSLVASFQDERIRFWRNPANLGIAGNMAGAFQMARGQYVASLNDDDRWHEDFLEKLVSPLEANPELVLSFCDYEVIDAAGTVNPEATEQRSRREKRHRLQPGMHQPFWQVGLVDQAIFTACAAVIRREVVAWDRLQEGGVFWDYYLAYLACRTGAGAYYCPQRLAQYRVHAQSVIREYGSRDAQAKIRKGKAGMACHQQFGADAPQSLKPYFQQEWAHANTTLAIGLMRAGQVAEARPYLLQSLRCRPFNLRTLAALLLNSMPTGWARFLVFLRNPGILSRAR